MDDGSSGRTLEIGREYQRAHPQIPMTVLRNEYNQGYGGNQKVRYAYAISRGADAVALMHGDGQYAPELLPRLLAPVCGGAADAVFGSRMATPRGALAGGMPLYEYVGNRVLTLAQNAAPQSLVGVPQRLNRVYSVPLLEKLQFRLNSNEFHFDTKIIIQLINAHARILELPIPTYYGNEICRVNGFEYAADVMRVTLQNVAHRAGFLYQRRFHPASRGNAHYDFEARLSEQSQLCARCGTQRRACARYRFWPRRLGSRIVEKALPGHGHRPLSPRRASRRLADFGSGCSSGNSTTARRASSI